jgi:hypothetical protein
MANPVFSPTDQPVFSKTDEALAFLKGATTKLIESQAGMKDFVCEMGCNKDNIGKANQATRDGVKQKGDSTIQAITSMSTIITGDEERVKALNDLKAGAFKSLKGGSRAIPV